MDYPHPDPARPRLDEPTTREPHPDPSMLDDRSAPRPAPYLVPLRAGEVDGPLCRRRVLVHDPWAPATRYDLVAVGEPAGGRTELDATVPVLDVRDHYRHIHLGHRVPSTQIPLPQLWIERLYTRREHIPEHLFPPDPPRPDGGGQAHDPTGWVRDRARPPVRRLVRGDQCGGLSPVGARAVLSNRDGFHQGIRVISEPYFHDFGWRSARDDHAEPQWVQAVTCATEPDWALWAATGATPPSAGPLPLARLFLG